MGEKFDPRSHIGEVHGIYTITNILEEKDKTGHWVYECVCNECGFKKFLTYNNVGSPSKIVTHCKHLRANGSFVADYQWKNQRLRLIFNKMMTRCYDVNSKDYRWYGAKGITICEEWKNNLRSFEEWAINNGYSDSLTIDRIDSNKNYCPENCRWISSEENSRRAGKVTWIEVNGQTMTGRQWADYLKIGTNAINKSVRKYGIEKTRELIVSMLKDPPSEKHLKPKQTWFSVYGIQV